MNAGMGSQSWRLTARCSMSSALRSCSHARSTKSVISLANVADPSNPRTDTGQSPADSVPNSVRINAVCSGPVSSTGGEVHPARSGQRSTMRAANEWYVEMSSSPIDRSSWLRSLCAMSAAPRREKLTTRIRSGGTMSFVMRCRMRRTRNSVFPVPGPPTMSCLPSVAATAFSQSCGANSVPAVLAVTGTPYRPPVTRSR
ncbi:hypothetical protein BMS3Bbin02_01808 [bacterium BMS3Bbin02]|nr:hypothetical protein BMS3Bbin02_01808 [bacterium BMS3Bbin02]